MEEDDGVGSYHGRVIAFTEHAECNPNYPRMKVIHPSDSDEVLELLRLARQQVGHWFSDGFGTIRIYINQDSDLGQSLEPVFQRSSYVDSCIDCLRHPGKSEEAIDHVVREWVQWMKGERAVSEDDLAGNQLYFNWLVGRDNIGSWCQKIPELRSILSGERDVTETSD